MNKALIIDDDPIAHAVLEDALRVCGFSQFRFAANGIEATRIYKAESESIDLIVSDIVMPGFDGIEFVSFLATFKSACPVIISSGAANAIKKSTMLLAETLGVNVLGQLDKPLNLDELKSMISRAAEVRSASQREAG